MSEGVVLVIDQGSHASRAMIYSADRALVAEACVPVETRRTDGNRVEHEPMALLASVQSAMERVLRKAGCRPIRAGLATQRSSIVCWDRNTGQPLSPVISWQDTRAIDLLEPLLDMPDQVRRVTGLRCSPHYGASKMRWCLDHLPEVAAAARHGRLAIGPLSSYLCYRLCREQPFGVDPCNAARTLLYDIDKRDWSAELIDAMGLRQDWLPPCLPNRYSFGTLDTALGNVPLTLVTGDQSAVPFACGPVSPERAWIQLGTGAFVQRPLSRSEVADKRLLESLIWWDGDIAMRTVEGTVNGAGAAIDSVLGAHQAEAIALAASSVGDREIPLFLNGVGGLGSPDWQPDFESRFIGPESRRSTAVLESIVFLLRRNLERMGTGLDELIVGGGLARSAPLCQAIADLNALRVRRMDQTETTARGTATLLLAGSQGADDAQTTRFDPARAPELIDRYDRWTAAMPPWPC